MRGGDVVRQSDLAEHDREQRAVDALQPPDQIGLDLVADQPDRTPRAQRLGRNPQRGLEEVDRGVAPERLVQPLAEADPRRRGIAHRGADQLIAAEFEEGAVADPLPRRPVERCDRVVLGDPAAQQLARLVPVDQEHQRGAERGEERVAVVGAVGLDMSGDEIEGAVVAEAGRGMAVEPAPFHLELVEQGDEEFRAGAMHVGIGHRHGVLLDRDDDDMGVGGADIVLDQQPRRPIASPWCRGRDGRISGRGSR